MTFKLDTWYSIKIPSVSEKVIKVENFVIDALEDAGFEDSDVFAVRLALDEAIANAIGHGNGNDPQKEVCVRFRIGKDSVEVSVEDQGRGFDYEHAPDPTAPDRIDLPCGRGLHLMKSYMDDVTFSGNGSEVTMTRMRGGGK